MGWILPAFIVAATASACLGWKLGTLAPQRVKLICVGLIAVLGAGWTAFRKLEWWPESLYLPVMMWIEAVWFVPPAMTLFGLLMRHHREREQHLAMPNPEPQWQKEAHAGFSLWNIPGKYWFAFWIWISGRSNVL